MLSIEVVTPNRIVYCGEVQMVRAPGGRGSFQVLPMHAPLLSTLTVGELDLRVADGQERTLAVSGGFIEVMDDRVTVLAEAAEFAEEIDMERAEHAIVRAREHLAMKEEIDKERAEAALHRAINRLRIAKQVRL
jgi:F-type H+-transporting ATPase subunit epsilon